jgi:predicted nucleotidyltransferase
MYKKEDQKLVGLFLRDFVKRLAKRYGSEIDFIILYGSAARGEFIRGVSDIDLTIQLRRQKSVPSVKQHAEKLFWEMDRKHKTLFRKVCSAKKPRKLMGKIIKEFEKHTGIYVPIFVFGPDDIDWKNGRYLKKEYKFGAVFFAPAASVFYKLKTEGKILYGRDIRPCIKPKITLWERFKTIMVPFWLSWGAAFIVNFSPKKAVKNASKAVLYEVDAALFYLDYLKTTAKQKKFRELSEFKFRINRLARFLELNLDIKYNALNPKKFDIIEDALKYKREFKGSKKSARKFVYRAWAFVNTMNWIVMIRRLFRLR